MKTLLLSLALLVALAAPGGAARADLAPPPIIHPEPVKPTKPAKRLAKVDGWRGVALGMPLASAKAALARVGLRAEERRGDDGALRLVVKRHGTTTTVMFDAKERVSGILSVTEGLMGEAAGTLRLKELTRLWGTPAGPVSPDDGPRPVPRDAYTWHGGGADIILTIAGDDTQIYTVSELYVPKSEAAPERGE
ncbi:MAG: hypothetical protein KC635_08765 [Myxococcales bacterium]|nr:hypothetical protein [Myxococcales bacterium]